jgi:hypothetical protein
MDARVVCLLAAVAFVKGFFDVVVVAGTDERSP